MDPIFQKSLQDIVKGIRSHKKDPSSFISQAIAEIKNELKSTDPYFKAEAVRKLTYLQMLGYNISWASFSIVEVMSQTKFAHKRIGYLAANQSFTDSTDVLLLTTNLFKKELASSATISQYEIGLAINCLANIANKDLARDCLSDVVTMMNHSRPYVRKKAVLALFKLFVKYPQGLRLTFEKLKERLDDPESPVVSCAVNVICELANKNPKNYLALAPKFFKLLTSSSNNWMLIKVVKLLGSLVSEEPRLARKLLEPLTAIVQNTGAKSLQYECIHTITEALPHTKREDGSDAKSVPAVVKLCSDYLRSFVEDADQNLKYLGLVGLVNLLRSHPRNVVEHRDNILKCLNDDDSTIRVRALELLAGIVSKKSLVDLVHHLLEHAKKAEGNYRDEIISKVLYMCSKEKFGLVTDFAWYVSILLDLAVMQGSQHGKEVAEQMIDVALRVDTVRPYAVESMLSLLLNEKLILGQARQTVSEVLKAAAWIVGEYSFIVTSIANDTADDVNEDAGYWIEGPAGEDIRSMWRGQQIHAQVIEALLNPRATNLPPHVQCAYIQAAMKVFIRACGDRSEAELANIIGTLRSRLTIYLQSQYIEVQERASTLRHILSEFGILSLNWQAAVEQKDVPDVEVIESKKNESSFLIDLLDMPEITSAEAKPVDDSGARQAKIKAKVLLAAIAEPFYAVHSKAQRKVPVPEGLNIHAPFKESSLKKLLGVDIPSNVSVSSLFFIPSNPSYVPSYESQASNIPSEDDRVASAAAEAFRGSSSASALPQNDVYKMPSSSSTSTMNAPREDSLFYLSGATSSGKQAGVIPLSQVLADTFEEKKSKKKKPSAKPTSKVAINKRDMLPAGAVSSDDEILVTKKSTKTEKEPTVTRKKGRDEVDLGSVDITTPLRADEVLSVPKHREVAAAPRPNAISAAIANKDDKKASKKKVSKVSTEDDLLNFDWTATPSSIAAAPVEAAATGKPKKSGALVWQPLLTDARVDVSYAVSVSPKTSSLILTFRASSKSDVSSLDAVLASVPPPLRSTSSGFNVGRNLKSGEESQGIVEIAASESVSSTVTIDVTLRLVTDGLIGPESSSFNTRAKIYPHSFFSPHKVDEETFASIVSKSSSRLVSTTIQVSVSGKFKAAMKSLASFLRCHIVEEEYSRAASLCSKNAAGGSLCILLKADKDGSSLQVDIKVHLASKAESSAVAEGILQALRDIHL